MENACIYYIYIYMQIEIYIYIYIIFIFKYLNIDRERDIYPSPCMYFPYLAREAERIQLGEEVGFRLVVDVLKMCIDQWNHCVEKTREQCQDPGFLLKLLNQNVDAKGDMKVEKRLDEIQSELNATLRKIALKDETANML